MRESLLDRFCRYVRVDTQSSATSTSYPSTGKQKDLLRILVDDLRAAGLDDAAMDEHGYVMATLPSNVPEGHPAAGRVPVIGLVAHVDTYHEVPGANVQPQVHRDYDGGDIVLPGDLGSSGPGKGFRLQADNHLRRLPLGLLQGGRGRDPR